MTHRTAAAVSLDDCVSVRATGVGGGRPGTNGDVETAFEDLGRVYEQQNLANTSFEHQDCTKWIRAENRLKFARWLLGWCVSKNLNYIVWSPKERSTRLHELLRIDGGVGVEDRSTVRTTRM